MAPAFFPSKQKNYTQYAKEFYQAYDSAEQCCAIFWQQNVCLKNYTKST